MNKARKMKNELRIKTDLLEEVILDLQPGQQSHMAGRIEELYRQKEAVRLAESAMTSLFHKISLQAIAKR